MKLNEIQALWAEDCKVDQTNLGRAAARVPELHAKYLNMLSSVRLQHRKAEADYLRLRKLKYRYYRGELSKQELDELGWEQFLSNRPLKNEMEDVMNMDDDIITAIDKMEYIKTVLYQLEQILKSINSRTWDVKSAIEWCKFTNGGI
jgi:hypothetical protein